MARLAWLMLAMVIGLFGFDLLLRDWLGESGWFLIGVGVGITCAVFGSLAHDALAVGIGGGRRLP